MRLWGLVEGSGLGLKRFRVLCLAEGLWRLAEGLGFCGFCVEGSVGESVLKGGGSRRGVYRYLYTRDLATWLGPGAGGGGGLGVRV